MRLPLNYNQAVQLKHLFDQVINPELPGDVAESLVKDLMFQVYKKLRNRLETKAKNGYSLTLTDVEGKAFYIYFQSRCLGPNWIYEQILVDKLLVGLDKKYA